VIEEQETALCWRREEAEIRLDTSDSTMKTRLRRMGWKPEDRSLGYDRYVLPLQCLVIRSKQGLEKLKKHKGKPEYLEKARAAARRRRDALRAGK